jgi:hypothetical protein
MQKHLNDEVKRKRYELYPMCPKCRGEIYWRSYNTILTKDGESPIREEIIAHCENSSLAYRSIQAMYERNLCDWRGKVTYSEDGDLVIMNFDGTHLPYRVFIYDLGDHSIDYMIDFVV